MLLRPDMVLIPMSGPGHGEAHRHELFSHASIPVRGWNEMRQAHVATQDAGRFRDGGSSLDRCRIGYRVLVRPRRGTAGARPWPVFLRESQDRLC